MVAGCGNKCVKYSIWSINFLFFALGVIIFGLSLWIRLDQSFLSTVTTTIKVDMSRIPLSTFYIILYIVMAFGALLLIIGFMGCCGAACEVTWLIRLYFICVLILFAAEIVAIVLYFVYKNNLLNEFSNIWRNELVSKYYTNQSIQQLLDTIQNSGRCCGATACADYNPYGGPPGSCQCFNANPIGCATQVWNTLQSNFIYVLIAAGIILVVELFAMVFACVLISAFKEKRGGESY